MSTLPESLHGILDSAAALDPQGPGIHVASAAFGRETPERLLLGRLDVLDTDLPLLRGSQAPLQVVLSGGAGQVAGPAGLCARLGLRLAGLRLALRDYDDLAGNVRRVAAAVDAVRGTGELAEEVPVSVELPIAESPFGWTAALDEASAAELRVAFRLGGSHPDQVPGPTVVAQWIDAALDRETPFTVSRGLDRAVRSTDPERGGTDGAVHGLLNVLVATQAAWAGADQRSVAELLDERDASALAELVAGATSARRWFAAASSETPDQLAASLLDTLAS